MVLDGNGLYAKKSVAGVDSGLFGAASVSGEIQTHFTWETDGTVSVWYKQFGAPFWNKVNSVVDTSVTSSSYLTLSLTGSARITRRITTNEIAMTPEEWDRLGI